MEILKELLKPVIWVAKVIIFFILLGIIGAVVSLDQVSANLAKIELKGAIMDESRLLSEIHKVSKNNNIKGVLLYIDSPGGAVGPSFEISYAIKELSEKKPVVAYASGTMASGSYLGGIWADKIYANPGALIGSIGVIMEGFNVSEVLGKIGISEQVVKAGKYKEAGTMMRQWSEEERASLQHLVDENYALFTENVARARKLDINKKDIWADAKVFSAREAQKLGLIDKVATLKEAKEFTEKLAKVNNPIWQEPSKYDKFIDELSSQTASKISSIFMTKMK